jgi:hypothetical protein
LRASRNPTQTSTLSRSLADAGPLTRGIRIRAEPCSSFHRARMPQRPDILRLRRFVAKPDAVNGERRSNHKQDESDADHDAYDQCRLADSAEHPCKSPTKRAEVEAGEHSEADKHRRLLMRGRDPTGNRTAATAIGAPTAKATPAAMQRAAPAPLTMSARACVGRGSAARLGKLTDPG